MNATQEIRTRVAPSPTGDPHIGTAFIALFNYAFAKHHGGKFILRIEDTDQVRSTRESEQAIFDALHWVGIPWDEGPDVGGPCGPYRQSERTEIYREHCSRLIDQGHAFPCFCTPERLDELRASQQAAGENLGYDGHCAGLSREEAQSRIDNGEPYVVRMHVPREGDCQVKDRLRGEIVIPWVQVDYQVLLKSDGFPTYHLANVVDDHLMGITHVIRGEEWINSAPKHLLLYKYFGWQAPEFIHLPLLRNPDKSKLSKRKNPTGIFYYNRAGILPEALLNYLGLMGYALSDGREMFSLDELVESFDIDRVSLGGPIFDLQKLTWLNGRYLREQCTPEDVLARLRDWMLNDQTLMKIIPLAQPRIEKLSDFIPMTAYLFADKVEYAPETLVTKGLEADQAVRLLKIVQWEMEKLRPWSAETIKACFDNVAEKEELKLRVLVAPFYILMSGSNKALPLFETMEILGPEMTRRRIQYALEALETAGQGLSKKALKKLEKAYQATYC